MRVFFVSDIHGSETCFRKLVNAGKFYGADLLIMGGDLAGKELVPIVARNGSWTARFRGTDFSLETLEEVAEFERRVATMGAYTLRTEPDFVAELRADQELVEQTLRRLILERTEAWVALADERLAGTGIRLLIGLGNDDFDEMIPYLSLGPVSYAPTACWTSATSRSCRSAGATSRRGTRTASAPRRSSPASSRSCTSPPTRRGRSSTSTSRRTTAASTSRRGWTSRSRSSWSAASRTWSRSARPRSPSRSRPTSRCSACTATSTRAAGMTRTGRTVVVNPGSEYDQASLLGALIEVKPGKVKRCQLVVWLATAQPLA